MDKKTTLKVAAGAAAAAGAAIGVKAAIDHVTGSEGEATTDETSDAAELADAVHYHLVPDDEGWALRRAGAELALRLFEIKKEALETAREIMNEKAPSVLVVHRADGTIEAQHTYGVVSGSPAG